MVVAIRTGVPPAAWYSDPRALATAVEVLNEIDRKSKAR